jgi:hypothetical protein
VQRRFWGTMTECCTGPRPHFIYQDADARRYVSSSGSRKSTVPLISACFRAAQLFR